MKNDFSFFAFYFYIVTVSILAIFSDFKSIVFLAFYNIIFTFIYSRKAFKARAGLFLLFPLLISFIILPFLFGDKMLLFGFLNISVSGYILFLRFGLRFLIFVVMFLLFSHTFSPRKLVAEFSQSGYSELGLIMGIATNQIYYLKDVAVTIWKITGQRLKTGKLYFFKKLYIFLRAMMKHSLNRAENIGFALYSLKTFKSTGSNKKKVLKKSNFVILIHMGIIIAFVMGVLRFK